MNKDIIYIDTEDDITAIIGKIKASKDKIIALVPPKRIGILQSAVNLRLLERAAKNNKKHLVLITNNKALMALASSAKIPVAKNLQSKPEVAEISALEIDDEDVIDGAKLPIGELVKTVDSTRSNDDDAEEDVEDVIDEIDIDKDEEEIVLSQDDIEKSDKDSKKTAKISTTNTPKIKIPDFSIFRKRLFIGGTLLVALIAFLVWATQYAPAATVIITAKTSKEPISLAIKLGGTEATSIEKNTIQTVTKQLKREMSVEFTATGTKDIGEKATGTITIENCDDNTPFTITAGTIFEASSGEQYTNATAVLVPPLTGSASLCRNTGAGAGTVDVTVTAIEAGTDYNISAKEYSIDGVTGDVYAHGTVMAGGTTKMATVVTAEDVQKASDALMALSTDSYKRQVANQFKNGETIITDSFLVTREAGVSTPVVGAEATTKGKLVSMTTFSMKALAKSEIELYLKNALTKQIAGKTNQRIYDDGIDDVTISGYIENEGVTTVNIATTGKIGPDINQDDIKKQVKGMRFGDVQALISAIKGVSDVDIKFSYFWVNTVPDDTSKIKVQFKLQDE